jgi:hypothetical protein
VLDEMRVVCVEVGNLDDVREEGGVVGQSIGEVDGRVVDASELVGER